MKQAEERKKPAQKGNSAAFFGNFQNNNLINKAGGNTLGDRLREEEEFNERKRAEKQKEEEKSKDEAKAQKEEEVDVGPKLDAQTFYSVDHILKHPRKEFLGSIENKGMLENFDNYLRDDESVHEGNLHNLALKDGYNSAGKMAGDFVAMPYDVYEYFA